MIWSQEQQYRLVLVEIATLKFKLDKASGTTLIGSGW